MTVTVEMTDEEFSEFLQYRKTKNCTELKGALNSVRANMENLANTLLKAIDYDLESEEKPSVKNDELFDKAVQLAVDWFC